MILLPHLNRFFCFHGKSLIFRCIIWEISLGPMISLCSASSMSKSGTEWPPFNGSVSKPCTHVYNLVLRRNQNKNVQQQLHVDKPSACFNWAVGGASDNRIPDKFWSKRGRISQFIRNSETCLTSPQWLLLSALYKKNIQIQRKRWSPRKGIPGAHLYAIECTWNSSPRTAIFFGIGS